MSGAQTWTPPKGPISEEDQRKLIDLSLEELLAMKREHVLTANDIREIFNLPPHKDGNILKG